MWHFHTKLPLPDNRRLLPTPKETYDLNLGAVILNIWSIRTDFVYQIIVQLLVASILFCSASIPSTYTQNQQNHCEQVDLWVPTSSLLLPWQASATRKARARQPIPWYQDRALAHRKENPVVFLRFFLLLNSLKQKDMQEFTRFLSTNTQEFIRFCQLVSSQRRVTRSDVSFQTN